MVKLIFDTSTILGDALFSLIAFSNSVGVDAEDALKLALEKYEKRFFQKGSIGSEE
ncbi:MAG: hypothetical protein N4A40_02940 [Tissierellales bacterium]|nr:hypothetical protein [Tissierellales bacterium]